MAEISKGLLDNCGAGEGGEGGEGGERGKRGKRGKRGHDGRDGERGERGHDGHDGRDGATGATGPAGATGPTGSAKSRCNCPCADCPDCPPVELVGCGAVKSPYFINVCCNCGPAINQPCVCQPNTRDDGIQIGIQDVGRCVIGTVVLVSGAVTDTSYFLYQINELARLGYRVIAVTLRGNGDGDQPFEPYSYDVFADDLRQVLDCLGVDDVTLVGHSAGSGTVLHYAARHDACRVGRLVLVSTPALDPTPPAFSPAGAAGLMALMQIDYPTAIEVFAAAVAFPQVATPATFQFAVRNSLKTRLYSALQQIQAVAIDAPTNSVLLNDLPSVTVPTLIIHGVLDVIAPFLPTALTLNAGIAGSTLVPFPLSGHIPFQGLERQMFTDLVADFASAGTCAMCPPDPIATPPAPQLLSAPRLASPQLAPTTPASFDRSAWPVVKHVVDWTLDGPVFEP